MKVRTRRANRAAVYIRMSTEEQSASPERQRRDCIDYAAKHGLDVIEEFLDEGISGVDSTGDRPEFQRLIESAHRFDALIVWQLSRLTRSDPMQVMAELLPLRDAGIALHTVNKGQYDWDDFSGQLMMSLESHASNEYTRKISDGVTSARRQAALQGLWHGVAPFGYRKDKATKRLVVEPGEAAIVQEIFKRYARGESYRNLQRYIVDVTDRHRTVAFIGRVLKRETYLGIVISGRWSAAKFNKITVDGIETRSGRKSKQIVSEEYIRTEDAHPAIIDRKLFDQVQERIKAGGSTSTPVKRGGRHLFAGLLRCPRCGMNYIGNGNGRYVCGSNNRVEPNGCKRSWAIQEKDILPQVLSAIEARVAPERLQEARSAAMDKASASQKGIKTGGLRRRLNATEKKIEKGSENLLLLDADLLPTAQEQLRKLKDEASDLTEQIKLAEATPGDVANQIEQRFSEARSMLDQLVIAADAKDVPLFHATFKRLFTHVEPEVVPTSGKRKRQFDLIDGTLVIEHKPHANGHRLVERFGYAGLPADIIELIESGVAGRQVSPHGRFHADGEVMVLPTLPKSKLNKDSIRAVEQSSNAKFNKKGEAVWISRPYQSTTLSVQARHWRVRVDV